MSYTDRHIRREMPAEILSQLEGMVCDIQGLTSELDCLSTLASIADLSTSKVPIRRELEN